jgi:hypothetical protein
VLVVVTRSVSFLPPFVGIIPSLGITIKLHKAFVPHFNKPALPEANCSYLFAKLLRIFKFQDFQVRNFESDRKKSEWMQNGMV